MGLGFGGQWPLRMGKTKRRGENLRSGGRRRNIFESDAQINQQYTAYSGAGT